MRRTRALKPHLRRWEGPNGEERIAWQVSYYDEHGKRRRVQFDSEKEAKRWKPPAHHPDPNSVTMGEAADIWLEACKRGRSGREPVEPHTHRQYETHVKYHIKPLLGDRRLSELTGPEVQVFLDELQKGRSRALAKKVLTSLKSIVNEAIVRGLTQTNPVQPFTLKTNGRHRKRVEIPSREEVAALISTLGRLAAQTNKQYARAWRRYRAMIVTALLTGIRPGELRGLAWPHIDFKRKELRIEQRADELGTLGPPKSRAGRRTVHLSPELIKVLAEWRSECPPGVLKLVFPNWEGKVENLANMKNRCWVPLMRQAGLVDSEGRPRYRLYDLRHFRASVLLSSGASVREVMDEIGHASSSVTLDTYAHVIKEDASKQKQRAAEIEESLLPEKPWHITSQMQVSLW